MTMYDDDTCYRALQGRDPRFDGRFYTGVTSTGVYCRPICPARTPARRNCTFHATAEAAEAAGFRPCLRCRPETAPGSPAWRGTDATVDRAIKLIDAGALDGGSVSELAARLGVGDRHLRRLFVERLGAPPRDVARTRRLQLARRLLLETDWPVGRIALTAGFGTPRRFGAAAGKAWGRSPSSLRRARGAGKGDGLTLRLSARLPYIAADVLAYLAPRLMRGVEELGHGEYLRAVEIEGGRGVLCVRPTGHGVELTVPAELDPGLRVLISRVRRVFDLDTDTDAVASHLARDPGLAAVLAGRSVPRLPGAWDPFELTVRAVLGQQVSVKAASTLAARLVARWGRPLAVPVGGVTHLFPTPEEMTRADLGEVGVTRARAETIRRIAWAVVDGSLDLDDSMGAPRALLDLRGVGPWTVEYVRLRALGDPDAFPAGDLGLRRALAAAGETWTESRLRERAESWRPWRGYAARLLWASLGERSGG